MMQSAPAVPVRTSLFDVPMMMLVPAGQQLASSPSCAVTDCCAVTTLPRASVNFQVTTVVPSGRTAGALCENVTGPHALASGGGNSPPALHDVTVTGGRVPTTGGAVHTPSSGGVPAGVNAPGGRSVVSMSLPRCTNTPGPSCHGIGSASTSPVPDALPSQVIPFAPGPWRRY